jgi:hypothetical protein
MVWIFAIVTLVVVVYFGYFSPFLFIFRLFLAEHGGEDYNFTMRLTIKKQSINKPRIAKI